MGSRFDAYLHSCFSVLPSSFIAALYGRSPSVVITSGEPWRLSAFLHEGEGGYLVAGLADVAFEDFAFLVYRTPEVVGLAVDLHIDPIEMPTPLAEAAHPADPLSANVCREHRTKAIPPEPDGFMANVDAALKQQIFDVAQRQREPDIRQHHKADRLRRGVEAPEGARRESAGFARYPRTIAALNDSCHVGLTAPLSTKR